MNTKGLIYSEINEGKGLVLDPDNVFWGIFDRDTNGNSLIPREIISLYEGLNDNLDNQMRNFRFSANLTALYIDPTDRCNANCPYCYVPLEIRRKGRSMTKEELFFILKKASLYFKGQKRKAVIIFHASEPLLVKDIIFAAIEKFAKEFKFGLQTNATLLKREDVEFLKKHRVGVGISLDSSLPKVNNRLRPIAGGDGNFKNALQAIEWFDGYSGLNVITTITKFNVRNLPGIVKFLHNKRVPCVLLNPVRLTQKNSRSLKPDEEIMLKYFIQAVDTAMRLSKGSKRRIIIGNFANIILGIVAPNARRLMCDISPCGGGRCFLTVTARGEMIPCGEFIGLKNSSGGNIFKSGIEKAMQSKPFKNIRSRIVEDIPECSICAYRNICGAPCPAELYSFGNMRNKAIFCEFYKGIIRHAFKLIAQGREKYCFRPEGLSNLKYAYTLSAHTFSRR